MDRWFSKLDWSVFESAFGPAQVFIFSIWAHSDRDEIISAGFDHYSINGFFDFRGASVWWCRLIRNDTSDDGWRGGDGGAHVMCTPLCVVKCQCADAHRTASYSLLSDGAALICSPSDNKNTRWLLRAPCCLCSYKRVRFQQMKPQVITRAGY